MAKTQKLRNEKIASKFLTAAITRITLPATFYTDSIDSSCDLHSEQKRALVLRAVLAVSVNGKEVMGMGRNDNLHTVPAQPKKPVACSVPQHFFWRRR